MKLFFDARYIRTDYHDGISRYCAELGNALAELTPVTFLICDKKQEAFLPEGSKTILIHAPTSWKEPFGALAINRYNPDVVISPMQTFGTFGRRFKVILTLHDLIYYRHRTPPRNLPELIRIGWRLYHMSYVPQRIALDSADIVATVSQTSYDEIKAVKLTKRPLIVVPNAPRQLSRTFAHTDHITHIVYMGSFMTYKNVETILQGMSYLSGYTLHLLSPITPERKRELEKRVPIGSQVIFHNGVSDEAYVSLLKDNAILVTASLDEGYGLPIAEALSLKVPAVISDIPIFHEVGGPGALYFKAKNPKDFADKVKQAAQPAKAHQLGEAGYEHIQTYSWQKSAKELLLNAQSLIETIAEQPTIN